MIVASFNVNSIRQRLEGLALWLKERAPDVVCLQEIKCVDEAFPHEFFEGLGYNIATFGQKTFNGVAIFSKLPMEIEARGLPGFEDAQARYLEIVFSHAGQAWRVVNVYCPNGNPVPGEKFVYKQAFMSALEVHLRHLLTYEENLIVAGDYNIIPEARDAKHPEAWQKDALFLPESRAMFQRLLNLGFTDAVRACSDDAGLYTFWDYQAGAFARNNGIRIDHLLLSPQASRFLMGAGIDKEPRAREKPSDHVPVWARFS